mmetsp:Transcript_54419/g.115598  ORF Transcript_54419/g.115598 Transcript_54419/m.115598 type:complete len:242 (+) Transcript_54419:303-1028(+)|eukprot:CAMPEP_0172557882 /NCGR_PEP_ID=MMETSP1067-20121228/75908_1 /TAXON_ID=265564 ORGANISM="Thalassiosira punctigera, Strain Tpunct2005C2" /NCGR_SAMPLE_ID=MMETSP1067 /ASSEMBLY_ACC=CAM_ASM_000444 /LENGTH=241 /DNA_ID=CAMNT_0013347091 /DNA_START=240 /DNA_END=965 /DNA_ORIENTATION=+
MMATKLSSALVAPSKVANILDWRKALGVVMGLDITRERIGIAVAEHPDLHEACHGIPLNSLSLRQDRSGAKSQVNEDLVFKLEAAVRHHRVCAFVVNWPIQEGRTGEQCGKVLQVLDSVIDQSNSVVTRKRPFTLWCSQANASFESSPPDEWGRSIDFARSPPNYVPGMSYSSKSAIRRDPSENVSMVAANVLDEWVKNHWEINRMGRTVVPKKAQSDFFFSTHSVDEYNNEQAALQAALL